MIFLNIIFCMINFPLYSESTKNNIAKTKSNRQSNQNHTSPTNISRSIKNDIFKSNQTNSNKTIIRNRFASQYDKFFTDEYTEEQLEEAIRELHLPTWSRGYIHCSNPKSEVTCAQIVHAYRILNGWAQYQNSSSFSDKKHFLMQHLYDGVGNRMSTDTATFVIALMDNRTYTVEAQHPSANPSQAFGQAFDFHPAIKYRHGNDSEVNSYYDHNINNLYNIMTFDMWFNYDYNEIYPRHPNIYVNYLLFATMPYAHYQLGEFCFKHFGIHATYFICNYLMYIPDIAMKQAKAVVDTVPKSIVLFGVHLRYQEPNHFFSKDVHTTIKAIKRFLIDQNNKKPTVFALATDSPLMERSFKMIFPNNTIATNALRIPDADHLSALYDIALLEYCQKYLLTYRSTFSYIVAARTAKRAYFVEKESPDVFDISNSQSSMISMVYHQFDINDWQVSRRFHVTPHGEYILRRYYLSFLL